ncbi:MAG: hypothetical protein ACRDJN_29650 [Chloroflexota bacterium]
MVLATTLTADLLEELRLDLERERRRLAHDLAALAAAGQVREGDLPAAYRAEDRPYPGDQSDDEEAHAARAASPLACGDSAGHQMKTEP